MKALRQLYRRTRMLGRARRNRVDFLRALARRPQLFLGWAAYEVAIGLSARVDPRLKALAGLKSAALITCEYCLDIGSALALDEGVTERQVRELHRYRESDAFDAEERLVLELSEAMTATPAVVDPELRRRLEERFTAAQLAELTSEIAWENQRARRNQALGIRPSGFSDGAACALAEAPATEVAV